MNVLLISPQYPETFWNGKYALEFIGAKAAFPPLGLLTLAAMLPRHWAKKLVDLNVSALRDEHLQWADLVMVSAMHVQADSARETIIRCRDRGLPIVAGGPYFTVCRDDDHLVDHVFWGEAEDTLPQFIEDLQNGRPKSFYRPEAPPDLAICPSPLWDLIDFRNYSSMTLQCSRGCPHDCDFCGVSTVFGRRQRHKEPGQVVDELRRLYLAGWRGNIFLVDDNFIGHPGKAKALLRAIVSWQRQMGYPFFFLTQLTLNLAENRELLDLMARANFRQVFVGIETTCTEALRDCGKRHNLGLDPIAAARAIQKFGIEVAAGLIVGFDREPESVFLDLERLITQAGIPQAMAGMLTAVPGTRFHQAMAEQGRLIGDHTGDHFDSDSLNFQTKRDRDELISGYMTFLNKIYQPESFLKRSLVFDDYREAPCKIPARLPTPREIAGGFRVVWRLGVRSGWRRHFWGFVLKILRKRPSRLPWALEFAAYAHHYHEFSRGLVLRHAGGQGAR